MSFRKPLDQRVMIGNAFVKHHPFILHALKSILPYPITIMSFGRWGVKQLWVVYQEFFRKDGFTTSRRPHHQDRGRSMKTKRFPRLHDDTTQLKKKRHLFIGVGGTRTHAQSPTPVFLGDPKALPTERRLRHRFFQRTFLFKHYIDDTDDNKVDTIWLLDLQSIVEGVDPLDGHS